MLAWAHDEKTADLSEASQRHDLLAPSFLRLSRGVVAWGMQGQAKDCLVGDEFSIHLYSFQSEKPFSNSAP